MSKHYNLKIGIPNPPKRLKIYLEAKKILVPKGLELIVREIEDTEAAQGLEGPVGDLGDPIVGEVEALEVVELPERLLLEGAGQLVAAQVQLDQAAQVAQQVWLHLRHQVP